MSGLAKAGALREAAAELERFSAATYPEDVFVPPTAEMMQQVNDLLLRERGHMLDGIAAECYRRAITLCACQLRDLADYEDGR